MCDRACSGKMKVVGGEARERKRVGVDEGGGHCPSYDWSCTICRKELHRSGSEVAHFSFFVCRVDLPNIFYKYLGALLDWIGWF